MIVLGVIVYANGTVIPGWTSLFIAVLLLSAVQLFCLGLLGEYVSRIYTTVQNRPTFHVGFDSAQTPGVPATVGGPESVEVPMDVDVPAQRASA